VASRKRERQALTHAAATYCRRAVHSEGARSADLVGGNERFGCSSLHVVSLAREAALLWKGHVRAVTRPESVVPRGRGSRPMWPKLFRHDADRPPNTDLHEDRRVAGLSSQSTTLGSPASSAFGRGHLCDCFHPLDQVVGRVESPVLALTQANERSQSVCQAPVGLRIREAGKSTEMPLQSPLERSPPKRVSTLSACGMVPALAGEKRNSF
jgi:hypothetical protein